MVTKKCETKLQRMLAAAHRDYSSALRLHATYKVHDPAKSEDLVQDTFLKTWSYLVKGGKIDLMKAFLYHTLNDLIIDEYRRHKTISLDSLIEGGFEPSEDDSGRLFNGLDGQAVIPLMDKLPSKYQKVMRMKYTQELSLTEMSLITGQKKNALAVQAHRGLNKLKELYLSSH